MISNIELAWAGGLFEGEGTIGTWKQNKNQNGIMCVSRIVMSDLDVLERFVQALYPLPLKVLHAKRLYGRERKFRFTVATSRYETTQALIAMLWPYLGERRKEQARLALISYRELRY